MPKIRFETLAEPGRLAPVTFELSRVPCKDECVYSFRHLHGDVTWRVIGVVHHDGEDGLDALVSLVRD